MNRENERFQLTEFQSSNSRWLSLFLHGRASREISQLFAVKTRRTKKVEELSRLVDSK